MFQKIFATGVAMACFVLSYSQDSVVVAAAEENPKPTITGYVDTYFRFNFANAKNVGDDGATNNLTSFTNSQNSFELNMASVKLEHSIGKVSGVIDLGFGKRAEEFSYNDQNTMFAIKQAYLSYAFSDKFKLTAGSWGTHVGYEVLDPYLNRNYSMSYMFSYGPFFHTGVKGELALGKSGLMLGIANPTDLKTANFQQKMIIAQYSLAASEKVKLFVNYQGGKLAEATNLQQIDAVLLATVTDKFSLGYNGTVQFRKEKDALGKYGDANSWWGSAIYLNVDPTPGLGLTLRGEYFSDKDNILGIANSGSIFATTLSANLKAGPLTFIPELRIDAGSEDIFVKHEGEATGGTASLILAAIYKF
jgi:Putative beta-barrel porin-2, OmpL-like. bbp2